MDDRLLEDIREIKSDVKEIKSMLSDSTTRITKLESEMGFIRKVALLIISVITGVVTFVTSRLFTS
jgi:uncharacterized protein YaaQ